MNNIQDKKVESIYMKKLHFKKTGVEHIPLKYWELRDGTFVAIYQGNRGSNPELDFVVKYLSPNKRLRAPSHTHWVVDLLIKSENAKPQVLNFINDWLEHYDIINPFSSVEERNNYQIRYLQKFDSKYSALGMLGEYNIEFLCIMMELFIKCEKQNPNAFMFKDLLILVKSYCQGKKDFYQVISHSKRV